MPGVCRVRDSPAKRNLYFKYFTFEQKKMKEIFCFRLCGYMRGPFIDGKKMSKIMKICRSRDEINIAKMFCVNIKLKNPKCVCVVR